MKAIVKHRLFWPVVALLALIVVNTVSRPSFLSITVQDGRLYGSLVDILRNSAPLMLVALGMTIVIATRGIDLSVGAIMAVSGAVALTIIADSPDPNGIGTVLRGDRRRRARRARASACGTDSSWRCVGIQPIIATLVLMLAGRGIALLITGGYITTINSDPYKFIAQGYVVGLPFAFYVSVGAIVIVALLERRTALGVLTEAVGINPEASRLAGVRSRGIVWGAYAASGLLAGFAGVLYSSNIMAADANAAGLYIELDAILAVVLGGTSLAGRQVHDRGNRDRRVHHPDPEGDDHIPRCPARRDARSSSPWSSSSSCSSSPGGCAAGSQNSGAAIAHRDRSDTGARAEAAS